MDDSRTQNTLDALADLYLTQADAATPSNGASSHAPNHTNGHSEQSPQRLGPKLRIHQTPATSPAPVPGPESAPVETPKMPSSSGPARPWREVRQERREQSSQQADVISPNRVAPTQTGSTTSQFPLAPDKAEAPPEVSTTADTPTTQDLHDHADTLRFPASASRSSLETAASGVMTDDHEPLAWDTPEETPEELPGTADAPEKIPGGRLESQVVFLGNLPGFDRPWLAQYAQLLAVRRQRVAILHVTERNVQMELVSPLGASAPDIAPPESGTNGESLIDLFERLAQDEQYPLTRWLIHLPMPLNEAVVSMARDLDRWTLICGADDAASQGARQWLGQMLEDDRRSGYRRVGVSVMGSEPAKGRQISEALSDQAQDQLDQPVINQPARRQMAPVNLTRMGVFGPTETIWPELAAFVGSLEPMGQAQPTAVAPKPFEIPPTRRVRSPGKPATASANIAEPVIEPAVQPAVTATTSTKADSAHDFSRWIGPGAIALDARCPHHDHVQLALDQQGRVHLMAQPRQTQSLRDLAVDLLAVRNWATEHLTLLQLTQRQCRFDTHASPAVHAFDGDGKACTALVQSMGEMLQVHLLQQVHFGSQSTWVASLLN